MASAKAVWSRSPRPTPPSKVTEFYEAKCKEMGMTVNLSQLSDTGGMVHGRG